MEGSTLFLAVVVGVLFMWCCLLQEKTERVCRYLEKPDGEVLVHTGKLTRSTEDAACWDIHSTESLTIHPGRQAVIPTGLRTIMDGCDALIFSRSGLSARFQISHRAGVIDEGYLDEWCVVLRNEGLEPYIVKVGDRIAQVMFVPKPVINMTGPGVVLTNATRKGGFGSTG